MTAVAQAPGFAVVRRDLQEVAAALGPLAERLAGRTVLVTGAAGMLPAYIADAVAFLNDEGALSRPARLLLLTRSAVTPESRLGHLLGRGDVEFLTQDVRDPVRLARAPELIVHAASAASPTWYRRDPVGTLDANAGALRQLLELAREGGSEALLYFSSSEVYGTPEAENIPTPETYVGRTAFAGGRACYTEAKRFGEALCGAYAEQHGTPVRVVRPFHVHGPGLRLDDGRIVAEMIRRGFTGEPFELLSDGRATRTYGYVSDATAGFLKVLLAGRDGEAYNVGADQPETSILELVTVISRLFGRTEPVKVNAAPQPEHLAGAPLRVRPDLGKIRAELGYETRVSLEEGLERTIEWHRQRGSGS